MKYCPQDEFDKLHRREIVVIEDDVPHAWTFCLCLIPFENIQLRFFHWFDATWILVLREEPAGCFHHTEYQSIYNSQLDCAPTPCSHRPPSPAPVRDVSRSTTPHMGPVFLQSHAFVGLDGCLS